MSDRVTIDSGPVFGIGTAIFICWLLFWDFGDGPDLYDALRAALLQECPAVENASRDE